MHWTGNHLVLFQEPRDANSMQSWSSLNQPKMSLLHFDCIAGTPTDLVWNYDCVITLTFMRTINREAPSMTTLHFKQLSLSKSIRVDNKAEFRDLCFSWLKIVSARHNMSQQGTTVIYTLYECLNYLICLRTPTIHSWSIPHHGLVTFSPVENRARTS